MIQDHLEDHLKAHLEDDLPLEPKDFMPLPATLFDDRTRLELNNDEPSPLKPGHSAAALHITP